MEARMAEQKKVNNGNVFATDPDGSVKSRIVGTFHRQVVTGQGVIVGQTLAIITTLGTDHEVFAEVAGVVKSIDVSDGDPVEFGQQLLTIEIHNAPVPPTNSRVKHETT